MASPNKKIVEQAAGLTNQVAHEMKFDAQKAANNQRWAQGREITQEATKGKGILGMLGAAFGLASTVAFMPFLVKMPLALLGKIKPLAGITAKASKVMDLQHVPIKDFTAKAGEAIHQNVTKRLTTSQSSGLLSYAKNTMQKSSIGKKALENMKDQSVGNVILNTGFAVRDVASVAFSFKDKIKILKQMQKDITGKDVSSLSILMGGDSLNPMVKQARKEAFGGKSLSSSALQIAGAAGNLYLAFFDKSQGLKGIAKAMAVGAVPGMAANMLASGNTALQSYRDMTLSMAQTGKADVSLYEGLIGGLSQKAPGELVRQIAEKAYIQQMKPSEVVKMLSETDFMKKPASGKFVAAEMARRNAAGRSGAALAGA